LEDVSTISGGWGRTLVAGRYSQTAESKVIWRAQAVLADRSTKDPGGDSDDRTLIILDLLRAAAFEFFGETQDWTGHYAESKVRKEPAP
jgi:hypothetical protein